MLPYFSSVPAVAVPGQFTIGGVTGPATWPYYLYVGHEPLYYLDYLSLHGTLHAYPGQIYPLILASGRVVALPVPPADGRWLPLPSGGGMDAMVIFLARREASAMLHGARVLSAARHAAAAREPYRQYPALPPPEKTKEPVPPSQASVMVAASRAANAERHARLARGEKADGG